MALICLRYDLRSAPGIGVASSDLYRTALDQARWCDTRIGIDQIRLSEHHGTDDGYCPSPLVAASAFGAVTSRARIVVSAIVLPLHDPIDIAEQVAVADLVCGGRLDVVFAAGYRPSEFAMFGRSMNGRMNGLDSSIDLLRRCWTGETFVFEGRTVRVTPRPVQHPHPPLYLGGSTPAAARRAARLDIGFMPGVMDHDIVALYQRERSNAQRGPGRVIRPNAPMGVYVSEDPERLSARLAPFVLHEANTYGRWETERPGNNGFGEFVDTTDGPALFASGMYAVVTPDECVALYERLEPDESLILHPLVSGASPEDGWAGLELFEQKVLPRIVHGLPRDAPTVADGS